MRSMKKSAGFSLGGRWKPARSKCPSDSSAAPRYAVNPSRGSLFTEIFGARRRRAPRGRQRASSRPGLSPPSKPPGVRRRRAPRKKKHGPAADAEEQHGIEHREDRVSRLVDHRHDRYPHPRQLLQRTEHLERRRRVQARCGLVQK